MPKLKDARHEEFCQQWIVDFNGARACFVAGGSKNKHVARVTACKWMARADIQKRIAELLKNRSERTQITQDMVLQELAVLGFSDFRNYGKIKPDGSVEFISFNKIKNGKTRAIKNVKESVGEKTRSISVMLYDKTEPLKLIGKHLGMFVDTHNVNLTGELKVITAVPRSKGKK